LLDPNLCHLDLKGEGSGGVGEEEFAGLVHWCCGWCIYDNGEVGRNVEKYFCFF
jgi:hypothetical protein